MATDQPLAVVTRGLLVGSLAQLGRVAVQSLPPLSGPVDHPCRPRQTLPGRGGSKGSTPANGRRGEQRHDLGTPVVVGGEIEQTHQRATGDALGQCPGCGSVDRDVGGGELLVQEPGVGLTPRMDHRHRIERDASAGGVDDRPHHRPDLFVGVGSADHPQVDAERAGGRDRMGKGGGGTVDAQSPHRGGHRRVGRGGAGDADDHHAGDDLVDRPGELGHRRRHQLRQMPHDDAQAGRPRPVGTDGVGCGRGEIGLDVPLPVQPPPHRAVDAHHVGRT